MSTKIAVNISDNEFSFITAPKLFSPKQLDLGTKFLLESVQIPEGKSNILDLGCGWGAIGIILAKVHPESQITLTDKDALALKTSQQNIFENKTGNCIVTLPNNVTENSFDFILSNLPWHQNLSAIPEMIQQSFNWLRVGGKFYAVINKIYRTQDKIEEIFRNVKVVAENESYKVLMATKLTDKIDPLREKVLDQIGKLNIFPDFLKDQNFLVSTECLDKIIEAANLKKTETILEIGPGLGQITEELAKRSRKVIALEIDERLKPVLDKLSPNVEVIYGNAWNLVGRHMANINFDKVVSNIPYSLCEPLAHKLAHAKIIPIYLVLPEKFVEHLKDHFIFAAVFEIKVLFKIPRAYFSPMPKINSYYVYLHKYSENITSKNLSLWVRRFIYQNEGKTLKNILCLAVEKTSLNLKKVTLTKNQTRDIVETFGIDPPLLDLDHYSPEVYYQSAEAVHKYFSSLS